MPVITLTCLIVVSKNTKGLNHVGKSIFEAMGGPREWLWQLPENQLSERTSRMDDTGAHELIQHLMR
jgi:hypothetical protein